MFSFAGLAAMMIAAADGPPQNLRDLWHWQQRVSPEDHVAIDLVRADVTVIPSTDDFFSVDVSVASGPEPRMEVRRTARGLLIIDIFAGAGVNGLTAYECYPSDSPHGAIWLSNSPLQVLVRAPANARLDVRVMEGDVRDRRAGVGAGKLPARDVQ